MWDSNFGSDNPVNLDAGKHSPGTRSPQTTGVTKTGSSQSPREDNHTPLTGYGRGDNLWGRSPTSGNNTNQEERTFPALTSTANDVPPPTQSATGNGGNTFTTQSASSVAGASAPPQQPKMVFPEPIHDAPPAELGGRQESSISQRQDSSLGGLRQDTSLLAFQFRTQSQILSDELYFQSLWFPPPPPPRVPKESRRARSELWYYYASKWDITHTQPPPPRCPLALMEEEHAQGLAPQTKVPYRGEYWLDRCNHWFGWVQENFRPPEHHAPYIVEPSFVVDRCATE